MIPRVVAVVQARLGSTRLPGKVLLDLAGRPMLAHVLARAASCVDQVVLATTWRPEDDALDALARAAGIACVRGSENDVLARFHLVPILHPADAVVRITGDCPLLDVGLLSHVVGLYQGDGYDLVGTSPAWDGLDVEVMSRAALARAHERAVGPSDREHVTTWTKRHGRYLEIPLEGPALRWSVDDQEGLDFVRQVFAECEHCREGQPHRRRDHRLNVAIHDVYGLHPNGAPEPMACEAWEILESRTGGAPYVSR